MARFTRWLMVGSVVASSLAAPTAEACWLFGCCGGAPRTTFYAPAPVCAPACPPPCASVVPSPCNTCEASPCGTCNTGVAATTYAQPTTALMPVTAYRPVLGWGRTQPVVATMPYTSSYTPYAAGYTPYTAGYAAAPYTSYRPVALTPTSYAAPVSYTAPVTVQYAPQPVSQATFYAPTTTVAPAPVAAPAPGCNCHSSNTTTPASQYWAPNSSTTVVQAAPITSGTVTNGGAVMTSGSNTTFGNTNLGSQGVLQSSPQQTPVNNNNNNVQPVEDPIKKSSNTTPGYEDPRNKTALAPLSPLFDNSQVAETNNAPIVRSLDELAPYNPVRMTSNVR